MACKIRIEIYPSGDPDAAVEKFDFEKFDGPVSYGNFFASIKDDPDDKDTRYLSFANREVLSRKKKKPTSYLRIWPDHKSKTVVIRINPKHFDKQSRAMLTNGGGVKKPKRASGEEETAAPAVAAAVAKRKPLTEEQKKQRKANMERRKKEKEEAEKKEAAAAAARPRSPSPPRPSLPDFGDDDFDEIEEP